MHKHRLWFTLRIKKGVLSRTNVRAELPLPLANIMMDKQKQTSRPQIVRQFAFRHTIHGQNPVDNRNIRMLCRKTGIRMGLYQYDFKCRILLSQIAGRAKAGAAAQSGPAPSAVCVPPVPQWNAPVLPLPFLPTFLLKPACLVLRPEYR